jgi:AcrR family transcriptional regulator
VSDSFRNRQGNETRKRLVKIAERLFAEQGVDAVSIRAVNSAAKLGAASIHYHFGSKEKLVEAVILDQGERVTQRVRERSQALTAQEEPPTARQLVELIAEPFIELLEAQPSRGLRWVKIMAQLTLANDPVLNQLTSDVNAEVFAQVDRAFPEVDRERLRLRWDLAGRTLIQMLSQIDLWTPSKRGDDPEALRRVTADLVDFVAGGVEAIRSEVPPPRGKARRVAERH